MFTILLTMGLSVGAGEAPDVLCRSAASMCDANIESFANYRCTYRVTQASAKSMKDAIAGQVVSAKHFDAVFAFRNGEACYKVLNGIKSVDERKATKTAKGFAVSSFGIERQFVGTLSDGLSHNTSLNTVNVNQIGVAPRGPENHPLGYMNFNWGKHLLLSGLLADTTTYDFIPTGLVDLDGEPTITMSFVHKKSQDRQTYWLSPLHGYAIKQIELKSTGVDGSLRMVITDHIEGKNGSFFPKRLLRMITGDSRVSDCSTLEVLVTDLSFNNVKDDDMKISVPAGTSILTRHGEKNVFFKLSKDEVFMSSDIADIRSRLTKVEEGIDSRDKARRTPIDTSFDPDRHRAWYQHWYVAVGFGFLVAVFLFVIIKRGRS